EVKHVQTLASRDPDTGSLTDRQRADPCVRPHHGAVGPLDGTRDEGLGCALAHEVAVVAGREADVHALGFVRGREGEARPDRPRRGLVAHLADRELDPRELALAEHVERVGLVLRSIARAKQMPTAIVTYRGPGVMASRESIAAKLPDDVVEQRVKLHVLV